MPELAYVNGAFGPIDEAKVPIEDRGFQFGDGVYEVIVAYDRRLFLLDRHMRRFRNSAAAIGLRYDFDARPLEPIIWEGVRRCEFPDVMAYVQITRGVAPRAHAFPEDVEPTVVMTFKMLPTLPKDLQERGARLKTTLDTRWAHCYVKAITLLPNVLAKNEALREGFDDALFVTREGEVRECTSSNIFLVRNGALKLPLRTVSVLHGVTQGFLIECAEAIGVKTVEDTVMFEELLAADEIFLCGTATEVLGVTQIDDRPVGNGTVGPLTRRLFDEFVKRSRT